MRRAWVQMMLCAVPIACQAAPMLESGEVETDTSSEGSATTTGDSETTGETSGDPACEAALAPTEFSCGSDDYSASQCAYLQSEPALEVGWMIELVEGANDQDLACVQTWLDSAGIQATAALNGFWISAASYGVLEPLCLAATINYCAPQASQDLCGPLDEAGCDAVPLCWKTGGTPLSPALDCVEPSRFALCLADALCSPAEVNYEDPDGGCWWFTSDCIGGVDGWQANSGNCPQKDEVDALPMCP